MRIKFFAIYREITGVKEIEMTAPGDVNELLNVLCGSYGRKMAEELFDADNELSQDAIILINGRHISHLEGRNTSLTELDTVSLLPMVAGG